MDEQVETQPKKPHFHDGYPMNLEAAALDAVNWLEWFYEHFSNHISSNAINYYRLRKAKEALNRFLPDKEPFFTETPKYPEANIEIVKSGRPATDFFQTDTSGSP